MREKFKKILLFVLIVIIFSKCFKIVFFSNIVQTNAEEEPMAIYKEFNYGDYSTIKLLHKDTNEIEELPLDIYLYGVVSAEMPATFEMEALKAQAIVARTYTIFKIRNGSKHLDVRS